jgi:hypothetical protein
VDTLRQTLETALRVLDAFSEHNEPELADVQKLKRLAPLMSLLEDAPLDEIACDVIERALKHGATPQVGIASASSCGLYS